MSETTSTNPFWSSHADRQSTQDGSQRRGSTRRNPTEIWAHTRRRGEAPHVPGSPKVEPRIKLVNDALVAEHREEAGGKRHRADEGKDERPQHHLLLARTGHSQAHRGGPRRRGRGGSGGTEAPDNRGPRSTLRLRARWSNRNRRRRGRQGANPRRRRRRPRGPPESRMQHFPSAMRGGDGGQRRQWRRCDGAAARHAEKELVAARSRRALEPGLHSKKCHIRS